MRKRSILGRLFTFRYMPLLLIYCLVFGQLVHMHSYIPFFIRTASTILATIYMVGVTFLYISDNFKYVYRTKPFSLFFVSVMYLYMIATLIVVIYDANVLNFGRQIIPAIGAVFLSGLILFGGEDNVFMRVNHSIMRFILNVLILSYIVLYIDSSYAEGYVFYVIFAKFLPKNRKWLFAMVILLVMVLPGSRMSLLRIVSALAFYVLLKHDILNKKRLVVIIHGALMLVPVLLLFAAMTGVYNVYTESGKTYEDAQYGDEQLTVDTRTLVFSEAIRSSVVHKTILFGRTIGHGYDSAFQKNRTHRKNFDYHFKNRNKKELERYGEVFIVNIYTWMGVFGSVLHFILFAVAGFLAIMRSKSKYMRCLGLYVSVMWIFCWIENPNSLMMAPQFFMWMIIGMCLDKRWRRLTNLQFEEKMQIAFQPKWFFNSENKSLAV